MEGDVCALVGLDAGALCKGFDFKVLGWGECGALLLAALGACYCDYGGGSGCPGRLSVNRCVNEVRIRIGSE